MMIYKWLKCRKFSDWAERGKVCSLILILVLSAVFLQGCAKEEQENGSAHMEKLKVVTTIFPQYDFVRQIAGDKVDLKMLLKPGEESHSYEPTPKDIIDIQKSDLFIYVGGENDEWVEDILDSVDRGQLRTLRLVDCVDTVEEEHVAGMKEERHEEEEEGAFDEHVWTSPKNAVKIVENITEILCQEDSVNEETYRQAEKTYTEKLRNLDSEFRKVVKDAPGHTVLFGDRFPFRYLLNDYALDYYAAFPGCSAETEASFETIIFLAEKMNELSLPAVMVIETSDGAIGKTIIQNTTSKDQEILVLNSLQSVKKEQIENGDTYLSLMRENATVLNKALL